MNDSKALFQRVQAFYQDYLAGQRALRPFQPYKPGLREQMHRHTCADLR
jgi:hypothetical protein